MFKTTYRAGALLGLILGSFSGAEAAVLKVRPWPLTDQSYAAIDPALVRVERYLPKTTWLAQVGERNGGLSDDLYFRPGQRQPLVDPPQRLARHVPRPCR